MKLLKSNTILLYDRLPVDSWLNLVLVGSLKGLLLLFLAFYLHFPPPHSCVLFLLPICACLVLVYAFPVCWQDGGFILEFIRSPRSSNTYHSQVSNIV